MISIILVSTKAIPSTVQPSSIRKQDGLESVSIRRIQGIGYGVLGFLGARIRRIFLDGYDVLVVRIVIFKISSFKLQNATDGLIENNLKPCIAETIIEDRDAFRSEVPDLISKEFNSHAPQIKEVLFKQYVQNNVIQVLKRKFEKPFTSNTSYRDDDHQDDDAPPEGEKRVKRQKTSKSSKSKQQQEEWDAWVEETIIDEDEVIPKDETPELITEFQNVDKRVPTIFDRIVWEIRQEDIRRPIPRPLVFFGPQRNPNEPPRYLYNKDIFFLKNGNTKGKKYILSLHKIHAERFPEADLEEKMNHWVEFRRISLTWFRSCTSHSHYRSVSKQTTRYYTSVPFPVEDDSDIGSPGIDGPPMMPEDPYAYIMAAYEVPPSPDYIPGPEVPPSPDYIPGPEEPQSPPPLDFVPEPMYPEYMPQEDEILPAEEQPLPATAASPTADSPGYVPESDPEEEPEEDDEDPEEDPADYPADGG
ncbi:hypothetical protein Tco_0725220 [Tanacetum coccineum]|uniref:Uncharacterized protein n=1 Tax=Tanacetum coccineum TaxID=301880 RepID=A0ABQ4YC82_9ASTR